MTFFICLFRDTFCIYVSVFFRSHVSFYIAQKNDTFFLSLFAPTLYITILGVAKGPFWRVRDVDLTEDAWRQS